MITRLRLDARLFDPPARRRRATLAALRDRKTAGQLGATPRQSQDALTSPEGKGWYGWGERLVEIVTGTALWHHPSRLVPIRYVLVRDAECELRPQAFLCTDLKPDPLDILRWLFAVGRST